METVMADRSCSDHFHTLEMIGKGAYGEVFLGFDKRSGEKVAIKKMIKAEEPSGEKVAIKKIKPEEVQDDGIAMDTLKEIKMLQAMNHENVVKLREVIFVRSELSLVFEYMENDLLGLLSRPCTKLTVPQIKCYLKQLLMGVHYLHTNKIIHRDIKPSNILVNNAGQLKLADFGIATVREDYDQRPMSTNVVTLWYRAPEVLLGSEHYGSAIDMWAVGCVFAELLLRGPILPGKDEQEQLQRIFNLCGTPNWPSVSNLPHYGKFVKNFQPSRLRETFKSLDVKALDLLERMLTLDPARRATAIEALDSDYMWSDPMPCDPTTLPKQMPMNEYKAMFQRAEERKRQLEQSKLEQEGKRQSRLEQERKSQCLPQAHLMYEVPRKRPWMRMRHQNACIK